MDLSNLTSTTLKALVKLTAKKDELIKEVEQIEIKLQGVFAGKTAKTSGKRRGRPRKRLTKVTSKTGAIPRSRGGLGQSVLKALEAAGDAGVKVAELAKTLKVKGANIHVWFATTGKKNKGIKKVGKGHYRLSVK
jgi:hypothetical protein